MNDEFKNLGDVEAVYVHFWIEERSKLTAFDPGTNLVDVYVRRLREKIDADFEPKLLHTVRGSGYVLKEPA